MFIWPPAPSACCCCCAATGEAAKSSATVNASIFITGSLRWYGTRPADLQPQLYRESGGDAPTPTAVNLLTAGKNSAGRMGVWALPFSCSHPRRRWGNRRRMGHWGLMAARQLLRPNCRYPNCRHSSRCSTPNRSFHCPLSCSASHRYRCNTPGPECRSDLSRFRAFGRLPETSLTTTQ